jgi:hypothetical protein
MHMLYKLHIKPHLKICMFPLSRLTHWKACRLKSFYLNFLSKFFFISGISGPFPSSLFPFLHFTITGSFCRYDCGNSEKKNFLPTYLCNPNNPVAILRYSPAGRCINAWMHSLIKSVKPEIVNRYDLWVLRHRH